MSTVQTVSNTRRHALRPIPMRRGDIHPLLKAVRTTYRAQRRPPQYEAQFVRWAERFGRLFPEDPAGQLARRSTAQVLDRLEANASLSATERTQAREVLSFLQTDILAEAVPSGV